MKNNWKNIVLVVVGILVLGIMAVFMVEQQEQSHYIGTGGRNG